MKYLKVVLLLESAIPKKNLVGISKRKLQKELLERTEFSERIEAALK